MSVLIQIKRFLQYSLRNKYRVVLFGILIPVSGYYLKHYYELYNEKQSSKYIAVVMSGTDKTFTIPNEFKQGFGDKNSISSKIKIEKKDDQYSVQQAKIVADNLVNDENCVMIIGNSNSELTEETLNSILNNKNKNKRPAFILPIATADNIISKSHSEDYKSILRMVPDNNNQAQIIKRFIFNSLGSQAKIVILVDEDNPPYSNNLSKNIASEVISDGGNIVLNQSYGNNQRFIHSFETLKMNNITPNIIIYVGVSSNGMLLIEELKAFNIKSTVIFTDGSTVKELMENAKNWLKDSAYFLSPVTLDKSSGFQPTYEPIGRDAFTLAENILNNVSVEINRETVSKYIEHNKDKITLDSGYAGKYAFNDQGNNIKMEFKIYHFDNKGELSSVQGIK